MDMLKNGMEFVRFCIYLIILIMGIGVSYGSINSRLETVEKATNNYKTDHELILLLNAKMDNLCETLKEVKEDVKDLKRR